MSKNILPESCCPQCRHLLDRTTAIEGEAIPKPNDLTVCINCGQLLIFKDNLALRLLTYSEIKEVMKDHKH